MLLHLELLCVTFVILETLFQTWPISALYTLYSRHGLAGRPSTIG